MVPLNHLKNGSVAIHESSSAVSERESSTPDPTLRAAASDGYQTTAFSA
jgi:hypothetical protein